MSIRAAVITVVTAAAFVATSAEARRATERRDTGGVPDLDVKTSCSDAQKFSYNDDKNSAYRGCMQDEMSAKDELVKRWSTFKPKYRQDCVEQARFPSPSYVEVLTCIEMNADSMRTQPKGVSGDKPATQIGGPGATGLSDTPVTPPAPASVPGTPPARTN